MNVCRNVFYSLFSARVLYDVKTDRTLIKKMDKAEILRSLVPDFDALEGSELVTEEEIEIALENHFRLKNLTADAPTILRKEATHLLNLFPSLEVDYVYSELQRYEGMQNRTEIVLRNILHARRKSSYKRTNHMLDNNENEPLRKTVKVEESNSTVTSGELERLAAQIQDSKTEQHNEQIEGDQDVYLIQETLPWIKAAVESLQARSLHDPATSVAVLAEAPSLQDHLVEPALTFEAPIQIDVEAPRELTTDIPLTFELSEAQEQYIDQQLLNTLCSMFPQTCRKYIRQVATGKSPNDIDDIVTVILDSCDSHPKSPEPPPELEELPPNQIEILEELLPDADPDFLQMMCHQSEGSAERLKILVNKAIERSYPTKKDYLRRQQLSAQQKQYTSDFVVEKFVKIIPDPASFFQDPKRKVNLSLEDKHFVLVYMRNAYNRLPVRTIQQAFRANAGDVGRTFGALEQLSGQEASRLKVKRRVVDLPTNVDNIPLLQELAYYSHQKEINAHLAKCLEEEAAERLQMKNEGLLQTCSCCYDEEVMPKNMFTCDGGCTFCKSCIVKSVEVLYGEQKLDFPCLMRCSRSFGIQTLKAVLAPNLLSKILQKKALEEVKSAGIEDLEFCPFCDFATIPAEGNKIFACMKEECMKESCRMCKELSHIPFRCDEVEKDADVKARVFVEDKMTEALLRKCYKCGVKFFKEEGCNQMTCTCGAHMCYICGQPVTDYRHFGDRGAKTSNLCPLYSDTLLVNKNNVLQGAQAAKAEIGNVELKHDPTSDLNEHFKGRTEQFPHARLLVDRQRGRRRNRRP